jgi:Ala-tRNA(Pro) deacylase
MAKIDHLLAYLNENDVRYQLLTHVPAFTAHQVALVAHVPDSELAKTLLVKADAQYWLAVLRADQRVNNTMLKRALEAKHVALADEATLEGLFPDCELGAMPPFGKLYGLPVIVEHSLTEDDEIVFNACTHKESIKMRYADFERLANPIVAEFAESPNVAEERFG